jgi:uncharacterized protein YuzE
MIKFSASETSGVKLIYVTVEQDKKVHHTKTVHNEDGYLVNIDFDEIGDVIGVEIIA